MVRPKGETLSRKYSTSLGMFTSEITRHKILCTCVRDRMAPLSGPLNCLDQCLSKKTCPAKVALCSRTSDIELDRGDRMQF